MSRIYVLVEGQTEEAFVRELLVPHYARLGRFLTPIIVSTSPGHKGGVVSYAKVKPQIVRLCRQDEEAHVTTMFDLYALPTDFPGKAAAAYPAHASGAAKALYLESLLSQDIRQPNFLPYLMVHEYEALLLSCPEQFAEWTSDGTVPSTLVRGCGRCRGARGREWWPTYGPIQAHPGCHAGVPEDLSWTADRMRHRVGRHEGGLPSFPRLAAGRRGASLSP